MEFLNHISDANRLEVLSENQDRIFKPSAKDVRLDRFNDFDDIGFSVWHEQKENEGEDGPPCIQRNAFGVRSLTVCDGLGGAGSTKYRRGNQTHSGAYFAARKVTEILCDHYAKLFPTDIEDDELVTRLISNLTMELMEGLRSLQNELDKPVSKLKSQLIRTLPTTIASMLVIDNGTTIVCNNIWAGDSRCYLLSPKCGLQLLSLDDVKSQDQADIDDISQDSPLSNFVNADDVFQINYKRAIIDEPCLLIVTTDGGYGYFSTPAHFERTIIESAITSKCLYEWQKQLTEILTTVAGDDVALCLLGLRWKNFSEVQKAFAARMSNLNTLLGPYEVIAQQLTNQIDKTENDSLQAMLRMERDTLWKLYKEGYLSRIRESQS